jgi:hypothetical protein
MKSSKIWLIAILFVSVFGWTALCEPGDNTAESNAVQEEPFPWQGPDFGMGPEQIERMLERIRQTDPQAADRLTELHENDPEAFREEIREYMRSHRRDMFGNNLREGPGPHEGKGPRERGGPPWRERMKEMQKKNEEYLSWLKENYPEEANDLEQVRQENPRLYILRLRQSVRKYGPVAEAAKNNPALAAVLKEDIELKDQRDEILKKLDSAKPEDKKALKAQLKEVVSKRFDLIVQRKQLQHKKLLQKLEDLKKQVESSEAEVEKWKASKDERVEARLKELLERSEKFRWD